MMRAALPFKPALPSPFRHHQTFDRATLYITYAYSPLALCFNLFTRYIMADARALLKARRAEARITHPYASYTS